MVAIGKHFEFGLADNANVFVMLRVFLFCSQRLFRASERAVKFKLPGAFPLRGDLQHSLLVKTPAARSNSRRCKRFFREN